VLRHAGALGDDRVTAVTLTAIGTGQMAESYRVALTYGAPGGGPAARPGPASVVAKITARDQASRASGVANAAYLREVRFYQELAPTLGAAVPDCLFAAIDDNLADFVVVLEDLAPGRPGDQLTGCSPDEAARVMAAAAQFHAARWGDPALAGLAWLDIAGTSRAQLAMAYPFLFGAFTERYGDRLDEADLVPGRHLSTHLAEALDPGDRPRTVTHGDLRSDNLLFDTPRHPVAVVDWQVPMVGPGVADVSYFLGTSLATGDRRAHERALVEHYHQALVAGGVVGYPVEWCWDDYRRYSVTGYVMGTVASVLVGRTERGDEMFLTMVRRAAAQVTDLVDDLDAGP
jgi:hypothetical protein